jgi:glycopeptide antibiotics resistance protein
VVTCIALGLRRTRWSKTALRASRWTYSIVFPLSLLYLPMKAGGVRPVECEWTFNASLALYSLGNLPHMVGFAIFFMLTVAQLPNVKHAMTWSFVASFVLGLLVEIAEGATGIHHCRMRDLIPDMAGALIGAIAVLIIRRVAASRTPAGNAG